MTDDLVKRLRSNSTCSSDIGCADELCNEAADRIEELETAFLKMIKAWDFWQSQEMRNGFSELCASYWDVKAALKVEKKHD